MSDSGVSLDFTKYIARKVPDDTLKIEKRRQSVTLVMRDGQPYDGDIFLHFSRNEYGLPQTPLDLLNSKPPFVVLQLDSDGVQFYNKHMISHLTYQENQSGDEPLPANLVENVEVQIDNGEVLSGEVTALLPPENMRLYDYLNQLEEVFLRLKNAAGKITLINKACIIRVDET